MKKEETPKFGMSNAIDEFERGLTSEDIKNEPFSIIEKAIRFGAEWYKQQFINNDDLEEAAFNEFPNDNPQLLASDAHYISNGEALRWAYKRGAEWQKKKDYAIMDSSAWNIITEEYPDATMEERDRMYEIAILCLIAGGEKCKQFVRNNTINEVCEYLMPILDAHLGYYIAGDIIIELKKKMENIKNS